MEFPQLEIRCPKCREKIDQTDARDSGEYDRSSVFTCYLCGQDFELGEMVDAMGADLSEKTEDALVKAFRDAGLKVTRE